MEKKNIELKEGCYVILGHDDESLSIKVLNTIEDVEKYVKELYEGRYNDETRERLFEMYFDESSVDGDSYSAYHLLKFENNKLIQVNAKMDVL